ncbi:hypothetical protein RCL_jg2176.t1 [Rhizophagus clarus]|uniref:Uncharacterized protein n=1 Tax=Rhizophagus clarus TaxID=94130 RepID=A0A8H3KNX5_9GLOM|nr:hypothetical protein RCL_jg2176.t1 [Rhizophagus clarus]
MTQTQKKDKVFAEKIGLSDHNEPDPSDTEEASSIISFTVSQISESLSKASSKTKKRKNKKKMKNKQPVSTPQPVVLPLIITDAQIALWSGTAIEQGLRIFEAFLHQPEFFQRVSSNLEKIVDEPVTDEMSRDMQNLVNSAESELIDVNKNLTNDDATILPQPSGSSNTTPNHKKKLKTVDKSVKKIFIDTNIPNDKISNIRDIFVYDIPSG